MPYDNRDPKRDHNFDSHPAGYSKIRFGEVLGMYAVDEPQAKTRKGSGGISVWEMLSRYHQCWMQNGTCSRTDLHTFQRLPFMPFSMCTGT